MRGVVMEIAELKAYTNRVKELESAVYTQTQLMTEHEKILNSKRPKYPNRRQILEPIEPKRESFISEQPKVELGAWYFWLAVCAAVLLYSFSIMDEYSSVAGFLLMASIGFGVFFSICLKKDIEEKQSNEYRNERAEREYSDAVNRYHKLMEEYKKQSAQAVSEHNSECNKYYAALRQYDEKSQSLMHRHKECLDSIKQALQDLYNKDVIFPKYRNFVAISAISEYLSSGRCYSLEGPDGAYNLYEMELRQNIVIGQLSSIVNNLEQIRSNQYSLYEELTESNRVIKDITYELRTLNETTKLNAYFNGVAVKIAASPTVVHGIIY